MQEKKQDFLKFLFVVVFMELSICLYFTHKFEKLEELTQSNLELLEKALQDSKEHLIDMENMPKNSKN
ncbi:hypothetical protein [Helicobacter cetorum]|uniref:Uncharacterized protein n=1 Tax=Helicobacter cetorum (strain ATCC BAA-429 / MIT 00-7128) TaxID=182217 RepID=I0ELN0_HELC0|nr:hypothetical protein [Helicobacter cetorum]AFI03849.1 hypothetical protein HCW_02840 [Helicobacter cetorum MIT 00-7128]